MNVIEKIRDIVQSYPKISELTGKVHIDFTESKDENFGLYPTGDTLLSEDVLGNQTRQHSFMFYALFSSINDYERAINSGILLDMAKWLEGMKNAAIDNGVITKITTANGMLDEIPDESENTAWKYQLQILAEYTNEV